MNDQSRRIIGTSAIIVMAFGVISSLAKGGSPFPDGKFLVGFGFAFFLTAAMGDLGAPRFASAMALIIMTGTLLNNAPEVLSWLQGVSGLGKPQDNKATKDQLQAARKGGRAVSQFVKKGQ